MRGLSGNQRVGRYGREDAACAGTDPVAGVNNKKT